MAFDARQVRQDGDEQWWKIGSGNSEPRLCWGTEEQARVFADLLDNDVTEEYFRYGDLTEGYFEEIKAGNLHVYMLDEAIKAERGAIVERKKEEEWRREEMSRRDFD